MSPQSKEVLREVGVALGGLVLTMMLGFLTKVALDLEKARALEANPGELAELLAVQFDLLITSLGLVVGAALDDVRFRGKLFPVFGWLAGLVLSAIVLSCLSQLAFPRFHPSLMRIVIPDVLGAVGLFLAVRAVLSAKRG